MHIDIEDTKKDAFRIHTRDQYFHPSISARTLNRISFVSLSPFKIINPSNNPQSNKAFQEGRRKLQGIKLPLQSLYIFDYTSENPILRVIWKWLVSQISVGYPNSDAYNPEHKVMGTWIKGLWKHIIVRHAYHLHLHFWIWDQGCNIM